MHEGYRIFTLFHAAMGASGLALAPLALLTAKGGAAHRNVGRAFAVVMTLASLTALVIGGVWMVDVGWVRRLPDDEPARQELVAFYRNLGLLFFLIAALVLSSTTIGALYARAGRSPRWKALAPRVELFFGATLCLLGVTNLVVGARSGMAILAGFGLFGGTLGFRKLRFANGAARTAADRIVAHAQSMIGAVTGAATAFTVQSSSQDAVHSAAIWVVPIGLGLGLSMWWTARLRSKSLPAASHASG